MCYNWCLSSYNELRFKAFGGALWGLWRSRKKNYLSVQPTAALVWVNPAIQLQFRTNCERRKKFEPFLLQMQCALLYSLTIFNMVRIWVNKYNGSNSCYIYSVDILVWITTCNTLTIFLLAFRKIPNFQHSLFFLLHFSHPVSPLQHPITMSKLFDLTKCTSEALLSIQTEYPIDQDHTHYPDKPLSMVEDLHISITIQYLKKMKLPRNPIYSYVTLRMHLIKIVGMVGLDWRNGQWDAYCGDGMKRSWW